MKISKKFISTKEAGTILGVTRRTIEKYIHAGKIKAVRLGERLYVDSKFYEASNLDAATQLKRINDISKK